MWDTDRKARLPQDWARLRIRVLRRDRYACQHRRPNGTSCGVRANQVDHIIPGDDHREENLQALCRAHHAQKSAYEGVRARKPNRRRPEPHPGLRGR